MRIITVPQSALRITEWWRLETAVSVNCYIEAFWPENPSQRTLTIEVTDGNQCCVLYFNTPKCDNFVTCNSHYFYQWMTLCIPVQTKYSSGQRTHSQFCEPSLKVAFLPKNEIIRSGSVLFSSSLRTWCRMKPHAVRYSSSVSVVGN